MTETPEEHRARVARKRMTKIRAVCLVRGPDGRPLFDGDPRALPEDEKAAYRAVMTQSEQKEFFG
jgi:hypothetical protein